MKLTRNQLKELIRQSIDELKEDKGDMDGDGKNEPDSEEYMDNKDKAIKKAMKNEGGKGSGRPAKPGGAKDTENKMMSAADAANAKMDAAEKASKKKKKKGMSDKEKKRQQADDYAQDTWKKEVKESKGGRTTVKEVKQWMRTLEENRYKKTYASDARRVSWMVNNEGVELSEMPKSMRKKWTKAQYGRERQLATEFIKNINSKNIMEQKLKQLIHRVIKEELNRG